jgi:3-phenylpropionate/trans-cinnamate dioxygenase ferredoxin reductase subunit
MTEGGMVIVGGGECGIRAAVAFRESGYAGPVSLVAAEQRLPYERPPLSKETILADSEPTPKTILTAEQLSVAGISVLTGNAATGLEREARSIVLTDGSRLRYDRLLIATGAEPRRLQVTGTPARRIAYLRTFDDALNIRRALEQCCRLLVIGGGFIGLEIAASARQRGLNVTVVEALPRVLSRMVPAEIATVIEDRHRTAGVVIHCGTNLNRIEEGANEVVVSLSDGRVVSADILVAGVGALPVVHIAEAAGLRVADGIVVDEYLRTSDPAIFAAGDCCSFPLPIYGGRRVRLESWRNAQSQGALAARNMLNACEPISSLPWFWSDQYDVTLQIAGLPDEGRHTVRRVLGNSAVMLFHLDDEGRLVAASGIGRGGAVARDIRLAEMLICRRARPVVADLSSPDFDLKRLLAARFDADGPDAGRSVRG